MRKIVTQFLRPLRPYMETMQAKVFFVETHINDHFMPLQEKT
jgi:hypothetical protein